MNLPTPTDLRARFPAQHYAEKQCIQERIEKSAKKYSVLLAQGIALEIPIGDFTKTAQDWAKLDIDRDNTAYTCHIVNLGSDTVLRLRLK